MVSESKLACSVSCGDSRGGGPAPQSLGGATYGAAVGEGLHYDLVSFGGSEVIPGIDEADSSTTTVLMKF